MARLYNPPMFEFEIKGGMDKLMELERELCEHMGFGSKDEFVEEEYDVIAHKYKTDELEHEHETQIEKDKFKTDCANQKGFSIIRLLQDDVYNDKFDWLNEIQLSVSKIMYEQKVQNIYICKSNEYLFHNF